MREQGGVWQARVLPFNASLRRLCKATTGPSEK